MGSKPELCGCVIDDPATIRGEIVDAEIVIMVTIEYTCPNCNRKHLEFHIGKKENLGPPLNIIRNRRAEKEGK